MNGFVLILFAVAAGFTASGIVASVYRLIAEPPESESARWIRNSVLVIAGPTVFFGVATRAYLKEELSAGLLLMAILALSYWSFAIGLFVLNVVVAFR
jgi:hypothetical protein